MKKNTVKEMARDIGAHVSGGNMKVGDIPNWSLTPGRTCSKEACRTCLVGGCYACKSYRQYKNVRKAWDENSDLAERDIPALERFFNAYFSAMTAPRFFRVHVAGDFVSREYAEMWARVAEKAPGTRFLAFTKQWENVRGVAFPENFSLVLSGWPGTEIPADLLREYRTATCVESAEDIPDGGFHCPGSCENCGACWELSKICQRKKSRPKWRGVLAFCFDARGGKSCPPPPHDGNALTMARGLSTKSRSLERGFIHMAFGNERILGLMSYTGDFKIRSKKDAQAFLDMRNGGAVHATDGEFYWADEMTDYYLKVRGEYRGVYSRPRFARGDIFFPYCEVRDPLSVIWDTRKYINAKWFSHD